MVESLGTRTPGSSLSFVKGGIHKPSKPLKLMSALRGITTLTVKHHFSLCPFEQRVLGGLLDLKNCQVHISSYGILGTVLDSRVPQGKTKL